MSVTFVAKASRIRNRRDKDYFIHRVNIPSDVAEKLELQEHDFLLITAQKAEWYHMLDWSKMEATWERLPEDVKARILASGLSPLPKASEKPKRTSK